jgi:hypothetical protein
LTKIHRQQPAAASSLHPDPRHVVSRGHHGPPHLNSFDSGVGRSSTSRWSQHARPPCLVADWWRPVREVRPPAPRWRLAWALPCPAAQAGAAVALPRGGPVPCGGGSPCTLVRHSDLHLLQVGRWRAATLVRRRLAVEPATPFRRHASTSPRLGRRVRPCRLPHSCFYSIH